MLATEIAIHLPIRLISSISEIPISTFAGRQIVAMRPVVPFLIAIGKVDAARHTLGLDYEDPFKLGGHTDTFGSTLLVQVPNLSAVVVVHGNLDGEDGYPKSCYGPGASLKQVEATGSFCICWSRWRRWSRGVGWSRCLGCRERAGIHIVPDHFDASVSMRMGAGI